MEMTISLFSLFSRAVRLGLSLTYSEFIRFLQFDLRDSHRFLLHRFFMSLFQFMNRFVKLQSIPHVPQLN